MATYTKKLKTLDVYLMYADRAIPIADTPSDDMATRALKEFNNYETMHYKVNQYGMKMTYGIPYHAVSYIEVTEEDANINKADPYGCEKGEAGKVWFTATVDTSIPCVYDRVRPIEDVTFTSDADLDALLSNPYDYNLTLNGITLANYLEDSGSQIWLNNDEMTFTAALMHMVEDGQEAWMMYVPCDITGDVSVTVAHK